MAYAGATVEQVHQMLADPAFREAVCQEQGAISHDVAVTPHGEGMSVHVKQVKNTAGLPAVAKRIVGATTTVVQDEDWSSATAATVKVTIPHEPGHIHGTVTVTGDGSGVRERVGRRWLG